MQQENLEDNSHDFMLVNQQGYVWNAAERNEMFWLGESCDLDCFLDILILHSLPRQQRCMGVGMFAILFLCLQEDVKSRDKDKQELTGVSAEC